MVGGLGDRFTRGLRPMPHNGLTVLPQTEKFLHGTKVAYGILVQSALLGQDDVLAQLTGACISFHLPTTLAELEVDINNQAEIDKVGLGSHLAPGGVHSLPASHADYPTALVRQRSKKWNRLKPDVQILAAARAAFPP